MAIIRRSWIRFWTLGSVSFPSSRSRDRGCRHLREPVQSAAGVDRLVAEGCSAYLEIGPNPVLLGMARQHLAEQADTHVWLPSLRRDRGAREQMLESLGALCVRGVDPNWRGFYEGESLKRVVVPGYPFQRKSHWSVRPVVTSEIADAKG